MRQKLIYANHNNVIRTPGSFRDYYATVYGAHPCPIDRFNLLESVDPQPPELQFINIVPEPVYNLSNLTNDWRDRFWSIIDQVADKVYKTAGNRKIVLMYSGGIDSTAVLIALMQHPDYQTLLDTGRFCIGMSTSGILEYPEFFYNKILPNIPIVPVDYHTAMLDPNVLVVTGDAGDYVIGNTDTPIFFHNGSTDNMSANTSALYSHLNTVDTTGKFSYFLQGICKQAPFEIASVNQAFWWLGQAFVHQGEMCYPFIWSSLSDLSELLTFNKIYRFFLDDLFNTFAFEYMSTNPYYTNYNSVRKFPREYIVNYTKDVGYLGKIKIFSQRLIYRQIQKTIIYADLTYEFTHRKIVS